MKKFDAIIIGSGQAGTPLAFRLADEGMQVLMVEKNTVGGTCVNSGCTPTKTYVASARRMWDVFHAEELGVSLSGKPKADLQKIKQRKDGIVSESVHGIETGFRDNPNITFVKGEASFVSPYEIKVSDTIYTAPKIFINVGARALVPEEYREADYLTNESVLELTELPQHLLIIGGSYIGLEFGQLFKRFGSEVTIIERSAQIINREDEDVSQSIRESLESDGVKFLTNVQNIAASGKTGEIQVTYEQDGKAHTVSGTHLLLAIGRVPNTDLLNLEAATIATDKRGYIRVNDYCETNVEGVFALGDCNGKGAFTHTAYNDFEVVASYLFEGKKRKISDRIMTYGLFVDPPLGRAGMTKKEALEKGLKVREAYIEMKQIRRAVEKGETKGFIRMLVNDRDQLIGAAVLGVGGDEIISGILNLMVSDIPYTALRDTMVLHPTVSELIPTALGKLKEIN
ncbi:mercuric reductase [Fluviicola sp.]|uniref:mercuric reductase n=1 Tax=Fluviicola sp. TaxID=1917219 RepID=UPI0031E08A2A